MEMLDCFNFAKQEEAKLERMILLWPEASL